jgi:hypothetical protein
VLVGERPAGGLYGLAFLCVVSAVVYTLFLDIPNPRSGQNTGGGGGRGRLMCHPHFGSARVREVPTTSIR